MINWRSFANFLVFEKDHFMLSWFNIINFVLMEWVTKVTWMHFAIENHIFNRANSLLGITFQQDRTKPICKLGFSFITIIVSHLITLTVTKSRFCFINDTFKNQKWRDFFLKIGKWVSEIAAKCGKDVEILNSKD